MNNITPNQIFQNYRERHFEICSVEVDEDMEGLLISMMQLARALRVIDADWVKKMSIALHNMRVVLLMSLQEIDIECLQGTIPSDINSYQHQYPDLAAAWENFCAHVTICKQRVFVNRKRVAAQGVIELSGPNETAILQMPSLDHDVRDRGLRGAHYIWKLRQLQEYAPPNLIISGSYWKHRENLLDMALLGGYTRNIVQLQYQLDGLEYSLEERSRIHRLPQLEVSGENDLGGSTTTDRDTLVVTDSLDPISSLYELTQFSVWTQLYASIAGGTEDSMVDVRLCLLKGGMVVPLRRDADVVTVEDDGSLTFKDIVELESEDYIVLPSSRYTEYRNELTDKHLRDEGHPELREETEEWKAVVKEAIKKSGGAEEFCSWCKEYGLTITPPSYVWGYTTDHIMLTRDVNRFTKLMKACYLVLESNLSDGDIDVAISKYWRVTSRLKSARRELDRLLGDRCEQLIKEQFQSNSSNERQPVSLEDGVLWNIWPVQEVGTETLSISYSRVDIPRKVDFYE